MEADVAPTVPSPQSFTPKSDHHPPTIASDAGSPTNARCHAAVPPSSHSPAATFHQRAPTAVIPGTFHGHLHSSIIPSDHMCPSESEGYGRCCVTTREQHILDYDHSSNHDYPFATILPDQSRVDHMSAPRDDDPLGLLEEQPA
eukprot:6112836-Amphidinium_carterae.1